MNIVRFSFEIIKIEIEIEIEIEIGIDCRGDIHPGIENFKLFLLLTSF